METNESRSYVRAFSLNIAVYKMEVEKAVRNFYAAKCDDVNILTIGRERGVPFRPGEDVQRYRDRVINAYSENLGRGSLEDIKSVMFSLGYIFNSTVSGTPGNEGEYNVLISSVSARLFDNIGVPPNDLLYNNDGTGGNNVVHNSPEANDILFELIQTGAITLEQKTEIINNLDPIIRASARVRSFTRIDPV